MKNTIDTNENEIRIVGGDFWEFVFATFHRKPNRYPWNDKYAPNGELQRTHNHTCMECLLLQKDERLLIEHVYVATKSCIANNYRQKVG